jgi:hypothetical protein
VEMPIQAKTSVVIRFLHLPGCQSNQVHEPFVIISYFCCWGEIQSLASAVDPRDWGGEREINVH